MMPSPDKNSVLQRRLVPISLWIVAVAILFVGWVLWSQLSQLREAFERHVAGAPILARWVQLVPAKDGIGDDAPFPAQALVRAVLSGDASCPTVRLVRLDGAEDHDLLLRERDNPVFKQFPVTVCEARVRREYGAVQVRFPDDDSALDVPDLRGETFAKTVVVLGDTGCLGRFDQYCDDPKAWPIRKIVDSAMEVVDDERFQNLIIHVGDYVYRGQDNWGTWRDDFFVPLKSLLESTPWVMVRGNHESCVDNAGQGWLLFLSHEVGGDTVNCTPLRERHDEKKWVFLKPYPLQLGPNLALVVLDSANASKHAAQNKEKPTEIVGEYEEQFKTIGGWIDELDKNPKLENKWLLSHVPIWGCGREKKNTELVHWRPDRILEKAWKDAEVELAFSAILSGDLHLYQKLEFPNSERPTQFIVGNGGGALDPPLLKRVLKRKKDGSEEVQILTPEMVEKECKSALDFEKLKLESQEDLNEGLRFGFLVGVRGENGTWSFKPHNIGSPLN